nr:FapA family protein [Lachnospiraceae bacterium]
MRRNAYFQLIHENDGIYLQSFPAVDGGAPLQVDDVIQYLDLKKFESVDVVAIKDFTEEAAKKENARLKVSPDKNHLPEKESVIITLDKRAWMAKIRLYPPSSQGERLTIDDLYSLLEQHNVKHGILKQNLSLMWKAQLYCTDILIAKADMPVQGSHASIEYHFDAEKTSTPTMLEDGSVDYHSLDMIEHVKNGQLLATLTPEVEGTPGMTVSGVPIQPAKVSKKTLKYGNNIRIDGEGLHIYSEVDGDVTLVDETVFVSNVYEVPADVGPSTGDIEYDGSVEIKGNVLSGYKVAAAGNITVNGTVEGAVLEAGGRIVLKNGVQGRGKAELKAEGDVITNFIESATVRSGGKIKTEAIMH